MNTTSTRLPLSKKLGYSIGAIGECIAFNLYYIYFLIFMTDVVGINSTVAGAISMISVLWDAITDPLVGHLSDRSKNPKGKRRPFILRGIIPLGITMVLLFTNIPSLSNAGRIIYLIIVNILFWLAFTTVDIPYLALGGEISDREEDKASIRGYTTSFFYVGFIVVSGLFLILVGRVTDLLSDAGNAWTVSVAVMAVVVVVAYLICVLATQGRERTCEAAEAESNPEQNEPEDGLVRSIIKSMKVKPFRNMALYQFFFTVSAMLTTTSALYFYYYVVGIGDDYIATLNTTLAILIVLVSPIVGKISSKMGCKKALIVCLLFVAVGLLLMGTVVPLNTVTVWIVTVIMVISMVSNYVISYTMVYDVGEYAVLRTGSYNNGIYMSVFQFAQKIASSFAMLLVGVILDLYGYDPLAITDHAKDGIMMATIILPAVMVLVSAIFIKKYSLTPDRINSLRDIKDKIANKVALTAEDQELIDRTF